MDSQWVKEKPTKPGTYLHRGFAKLFVNMIVVVQSPEQLYWHYNGETRCYEQNKLPAGEYARLHIGIDEIN